MRSKLAKTFRIAFWSHLVHHNSFWARKNCFAPNALKTCKNVQNCILKPFGASQLILSSKKLFRTECAQNLQKRSELHSEAIWCITTHSELEKIVSHRMAQNLLKRSELHSEAIWCITTHSELEKIVSLRMGSKLAKTFRIAFWSHLVHHNSFWARKNCFAPNALKTCKNVQNCILKPFGASQLILSSKKLFRTECAQNLQKRSELHSEAIWCITTHSELEKIVSHRMGSKLAKTFRIAFWSHLVHHNSFWARKNCFAPNALKTCKNVQNCILKPFGASQLILSSKKLFRTEWLKTC